MHLTSLKAVEVGPFVNVRDVSNLSSTYLQQDMLFGNSEFSENVEIRQHSVFIDVI